MNVSAPDLPEHVQLDIQPEGIFVPFARKQRDAFFAAGKRFVHYTSADAAMKIIESKRVWLRNATCMSDYREVQHGFEILARFFSNPSKKASFVSALDACAPGVADEAIKLFDQWWLDTRFQTYISSMSEHNDDEDRHGRLSIWRSFGGDNRARVAIVLRAPFYTEATEKLKIILSPVAYLPEDRVHAEIERVIENIRHNADFIGTVERSLISNVVFNMLVAGVVCLKHRGFHEEREWRVIYAPNRRPSPLMETAIEIVGGVPQTVYKGTVQRLGDSACSDTTS